MNQFSTTRSLSGIGNIITVGLQLYRLQFRAYFLQAVLAFLWLVVPIWGWAEHYAISTCLAHSAVQDLTDQPTDWAALKRPIQRKKWHLLLMNTWIVLRILGSGLLTIFILSLGVSLVEMLMDIPGYPEITDSAADRVIGVFTLVCFYGVSLMSYQSAWLAEVIAATEQDFKPFSSIKRSWALIRGATLTNLGVLLILQLVTFFGSFLFAYVSTLLLAIILRFLPLAISLKTTIALLSWATLSLFTGLITFPLWQTVKATLYYSLRIQREGADLSLRSPS